MCFSHIPEDGLTIGCLSVNVFCLKDYFKADYYGEAAMSETISGNPTHKKNKT